MKFHHDSKVADNNVYVTCSISNGYYEKFSGRKALESDITFELKNQSDNVVYLDLGNCFFKNGRNTENYYKNTATQTSKDKNRRHFRLFLSYILRKKIWKHAFPNSKYNKF